MDQELEQARIKHIAFKSKLRALLYGAELDECDLLTGSESSLGKWIVEIGRQQFANISDMLELEKVHTRMHMLVSKMIDLCRKGKHEEARQNLPEVEESSEQIIQLLESIDKQLGEKA